MVGLYGREEVASSEREVCRIDGSSNANGHSMNLDFGKHRACNLMRFILGERSGNIIIAHWSS